MPEYTKDIPFAVVNDKILSAIGTSKKLYYLILVLLAMLIGWGVISWIYQVKQGMGVAGINHPVGWGTYITNFVFWVGIAHSGTLISAILFLVRSKWRDAVSRSTEAMTVFAVFTAGLFPLIHLGRMWVFYYILPYPNQRDLYPNFMSPLVLDLLAILTYLTVSAIFFYFGLIPDAASARDRFKLNRGLNHWKTKFFGALSLGWSGSLQQWKHYNRSYLYFAMLATPLVISVHSIVSWDFAVSLLPGWHSTLFAPYFVAGAIHSGLAMALTLMIPMRKLLHLEEIITKKHLQAIAKLMILTTLIVAYSYIVEPFIEFYSESTFHVQFAKFRFTGNYAWIYYMILVLNVLVPLTFLSKKGRDNVKWLFGASILINIGMWFERYMIVVTSTSHDFMPHNWGDYAPSWVELSITAGTAAFFFFFFLLFAKFLPAVSLADFKDYLLKEKSIEGKTCEGVPQKKLLNGGSEKRLLVFSSAEKLIDAVKQFCEKGFTRIETFTPTKVEELEHMLKLKKSPVRYWTLAGGLAGMLSGLALTVGTAGIFDLIVGGKLPVSIIPFILVMFELTILFAAVANLLSAIYYTKLYKRRIHPYYRDEFGSDKYGLLISYDKKNELYISRIMETLEQRK